MNFKKFLQFSLLGGLVWSGFLVALGYFFGYAAEQIEQYIKFAGWAILSSAILILVFVNLKKKRHLQKLVGAPVKKQKRHGKSKN